MSSLPSKYIKIQTMNTFICLLLLSFLTTMCNAQNKDIYILAGQSNMAGRGGVDNGTWNGIVQTESKSNPSIFRLNSQQKWVQGSEPLHKDIDLKNTCGVGPGMSFANAVLAKGENKAVVGLVPCAVGGTNITQWGRGTTLYNQLLKRTASAVQGGGTLRAMLWFQGESDTVNQDGANQYKTRLEKFFTDVRTDLKSPKLLIIQVALASGGPYLDTVRQAQLGTTLANVKCVDAKGQQLEADQLHLTTLSEVNVGQMMANAFLQVNAYKQYRRLLRKI